MSENKIDYLSNLLETFDKLESCDITGRILYKPLYDYFMILIKELGAQRCGLDEKDLKQQLKTRWDNIRWCLEFIEDPKIWDETIYMLHEIRRRIEHDDFYNPTETQLTNIRNIAPDFRDWIIHVTNEYYKKSKDFTIRETFNHQFNIHNAKALRMVHEYGAKPPFVDNPHLVPEFEESSYEKISKLAILLEKRTREIIKLEDINNSDFENLIKFVEIISNLEGKEEILLMNSVCPKCGGEIQTTQEYFGGNTEDQPEPDGVFVRVGCQECDYYIDQETIYI